VENVRCFGANRFKVFVGKAEVFLGNIARDQSEIFQRRLGLLGNFLDRRHRLFDKLLLNKQKKLNLLSRKTRNESFSNKSGKAG